MRRAVNGSEQEGGKRTENIHPRSGSSRWESRETEAIERASMSGHEITTQPRTE